MAHYWKASDLLFIGVGLEMLPKLNESAEKRYLNLFYHYQKILNYSELLINHRFCTTNFICQAFLFSSSVSYS